MELSLQECLATRKDCSGIGRILPFSDILELCKAAHEGAPSKLLYVILPQGEDYEGGLYTYNGKELALLSGAEKTTFTMELYPELNHKEIMNLEDLINVGLVWQYLSLRAENIGLGVSQRARGPKKINKLVNSLTHEDQIFLYSVAVREDNDNTVIKDTSEPLQKQLENGTYLLNTPACYEDQAFYKGNYKGISLHDAIFNNVEKSTIGTRTLYELSQLLWACEGENDHATHGNRDNLEKNGFGRVHASGCAGYSVYPLVLVNKVDDLPKGAYIYNPVGFSALKRWIRVDNNIFYDHYLQQYSSENIFDDVKNEFDVDSSQFIVLLCIDRLKPCSGFLHRKIMDTTNWAEVEAGMALAGLQLQANALGLRWEKKIISSPDNPKYRDMFKLDYAETSISKMAQTLENLPKNEHLSLVGKLIPIVLFYTK
ncbi:MAG: hypothetical protein ACFFBH_03050 [Promethearchaeota archaeon]